MIEVGDLVGTAIVLVEVPLPVDVPLPAEVTLATVVVPWHSNFPLMTGEEPSASASNLEQSTDESLLSRLNPPLQIDSKSRFGLSQKDQYL